jgi:hypothetical protein
VCHGHTKIAATADLRSEIKCASGEFPIKIRKFFAAIDKKSLRFAGEWAKK